MLRFTLIGAALGLSIAFSPAASALDAAVVTGVQMPAWLERAGLLSPLSPGAVLERSDAVRTGRNARVQVQLSEGSVVKLGENALLKLANLDRKDEGKGVFRAALDVLKGAFRFTTDKVGNLRTRDVRIRVASVTAGIRGTDLWGKAADDKDIVCLIEGKIEVQHLEETPIAMNDPLMFYIAPKNAQPLPVAPVPPEKLAQWATETDIAPGNGALSAGGQWQLVLVNSARQDDAVDVYQRARRAGYAAELDASKSRGKYVYDVRIKQLASEFDAKALSSQLQKEFALSDIRIAH